MFINQLIDRITARRLTVAGLLWLIVFLLYLPAAKAGFVSDTTGWVQSIQRDSFWDYINRTQFVVKSMYQLTQFNTWVLYQAFGHNVWLWHLTHVTLHALNCWLLYTLCSRLFRHTRLPHPERPALIGSLLFAVSPYISEVVVWEASFHYLQALVFIFSIMLLAQRFQERPSVKLAMAATLLFFLSTFTLELFYLTPILVLSIAFFYRTGLDYNKTSFNKTLLFFTLPQALIFVTHLLSFRLVYGRGMAHLGFSMFKNPLPYFLVKAPWYFFHVIAWGRFFPGKLRMAVYNVFRTPAGSILFYAVLATVCITLIVRYRKMTPIGKLGTLLFSWVLIALAILVPLYFPEGLLVFYDRYMYLLLAFYWMFASFLLYRIQRDVVRYSLIALAACISLYFTLKLSHKWGQSAEVIAAIQNSPVMKPGKVKILLNSPSCLQGIPMIGTSDEGEFRLMHNLFFAPHIKDTMLEVAGYNMDWMTDGAHAQVLNDSTVRVTLNQWGTWWWLGSYGAYNYENQWFRLDLKDPGHMYEIILKKPAGEYQLLFQTGKQLKMVDLNRKEEQY